MMRFAVLAFAAISLCVAPAHADVTVKSQDGTVELTLPNGWHEIKPEATDTKILAVDGKGGRVAVRGFSKEDFKDMKSVASFVVSQLKMIDNPEQKFQDIEVNGKPAVRLEMVGTGPNGLKRGYVVTVFEADGTYIDVTASTHASTFAQLTPTLEALAKQIVVAGAAGSPSPSSPPTPAAPAPTAPKPSTHH
jgi:hypothetical protein